MRAGDLIEPSSIEITTADGLVLAEVQFHELLLPLILEELRPADLAIKQIDGALACFIASEGVWSVSRNRPSNRAVSVRELRWRLSRRACEQASHQLTEHGGSRVDQTATFHNLGCDSRSSATVVEVIRQPAWRYVALAHKLSPAIRIDGHGWCDMVSLGHTSTPPHYRPPYAAATTDHTGCVHMVAVEGIKAIAAASSKGPTERDPSSYWAGPRASDT